MIEISLLSAFRHRQNFDSYRHLVNPASLSKESKVILKDFEVYYRLNDSIDVIDSDAFSTFFFQERNPYLDDKSIIVYKDIILRLQEASSAADTKRLIQAFEQQEFYHDLQTKLDMNVDIITVRDEIEGFITRTASLVPSSNESMDLQSALEYTDRSNGLQWRCKALQEHFSGGLIQGDFGIIAGTVDSGKTSFIASEISYMAQQLNKEDYILWMSNEGDWKSILPRLYCATLNCTDQDLRKHQSSAIMKYAEKMNGYNQRVIIKDIQGWGTKDIESILKKHPPKLLIIDLLDHVQGFNSYASKEGSYEVYGRLYQWAREAATRYCPILGVSQMNGDGEDQMYPSMSKLRGSRVDKQAAATFQLMIGSLSSDNTVRYLSMPKNKINSNRNWKAIVKFDALRARYI